MPRVRDDGPGNDERGPASPNTDDDRAMSLLRAGRATSLATSLATAAATSAAAAAALAATTPLTPTVPLPEPVSPKHGNATALAAGRPQDTRRGKGADANMASRCATGTAACACSCRARARAAGATAGAGVRVGVDQRPTARSHGDLGLGRWAVPCGTAMVWQRGGHYGDRRPPPRHATRKWPRSAWELRCRSAIESLPAGNPATGR